MCSTHLLPFPKPLISAAAFCGCMCKNADGGNRPVVRGVFHPLFPLDAKPFWRPDDQHEGKRGQGTNPGGNPKIQRVYTRNPRIGVAPQPSSREYFLVC